MKLNNNAQPAFKAVYPDKVIFNKAGRAIGLSLKLTEMDKVHYRDLAHGDLVQIVLEDAASGFKELSILKGEMERGPIAQSVRENVHKKGIISLFNKTELDTKGAKDNLYEIYKTDFLMTSRGTFEEFIAPKVESFKKRMGVIIDILKG